MTISTTTNRKDYEGDGIVTTFPVPFPFPTDDDLDLYIYDTVDKTTILQTIVTHYTLTGAGEATGEAEMVTAPAADEELFILRDLDITQGSNYQDFNRLPSNTIEANFDRLTMICQQLQEQINRAIIQPLSGTTTVTFPDPEANQIIGWDSAGTDLENKVIGATNVIFPASGMLASDGTTTLLGRTISKVGNVVVTNGDGLSGNPTIDTSTNDAAIALNTTLRATDLGSIDNAKGASLVGVEDFATNFSGADVEAVLAEIIADYAAVTNGNGASKIGYEDVAGDTSNANLEAVIAELFTLAGGGAFVWIDSGTAITSGTVSGLVSISSYVPVGTSNITVALKIVMKSAGTPGGGTLNARVPSTGTYRELIVDNVLPTDSRVKYWVVTMPVNSSRQIDIQMTEVQDILTLELFARSYQI